MAGIIVLNPPVVADDNNNLAEGNADNQLALSLGYVHDAVNNKWIRAEGTTDGKAKVETSQAAGTVNEVHIIDANDLDMDVAEDTAPPANTRAFNVASKDLSGICRFPTVTVDTQDNKRRWEIQGKVSISPPQPPPSTTPVTIVAATPLDVASTETTDTVIANGVTFHILQIVVGAEGDPNEKGSKVEVIYVDASSVEHLIDRLYITGFTEFGNYPDTATARDGTALVGNGTTTLIRIKRIRLGGAANEVDAVVRGYTV